MSLALNGIASFTATDCELVDFCFYRPEWEAMNMLVPHIRSLVVASCFAVTLAMNASAMAGGAPPFESAARDYRSAVQAFERQVHRLRYLDRFDVMLVERLENAACDFYGTSFRPSDVSRVSYYWNEIEVLQPRVASAIFGRDCYPVNFELAECWERVMCTYSELALRLHPPVAVDRNGRVQGRVNTVPAHAHDIHDRQNIYDSQIVSPYVERRDVNDFRATIAVPPIGSQAFPIGHGSRGDQANGFRGPEFDSHGQQSVRRVEGRDLGAIILSSLLQRALAR